MVMDIRNLITGQTRAELRKSGRSKGRKVSSSTESESTGESTDSVNLTGQASQISRLISQMKASPAVDAHRVAPVKEKVEEGRYEIEYEQVANKMLDFESSYYGY